MNRTFDGDPRADALLEFWFGSQTDDAEVANAQATLWWGHDPATDVVVQQRFEGLAELAAGGALDHWQDSPRGRLALILLLDQVPRNVWRGTVRAFATDPMARWAVLEGFTRRDDRELRPIHRLFFYMPLEHSESVAYQNQSVEAVRSLADEVPTAWRTAFDLFVDYAERHRDVIERFGRFPHRNRILGRASTADEIAFLSEPGSSF
jgi:uncharacterized protein (DUF924 family)